MAFAGSCPPAPYVQRDLTQHSRVRHFRRSFFSALAARVCASRQKLSQISVKIRRKDDRPAVWDTRISQLKTPSPQNRRFVTKSFPLPCAHCFFFFGLRPKIYVFPSPPPPAQKFIPPKIFILRTKIPKNFPRAFGARKNRVFYCFFGRFG